MSCMTILFPNLQITRSDIRPHIKWADSLVIVCGHFNLPQGFVWVCMVNILTISLPSGRKRQKNNEEQEGSENFKKMIERRKGGREP